MAIEKDGPCLDDIMQGLRSCDVTTPSTIDQRRRAAVALVLSTGADTTLDLLFIERALNPKDPWSGHIAFPGGGAESHDLKQRNTAERETLEELGLDLRDSTYLGHLANLVAANASVLVSGFVYATDQHPQLVANNEVADAFWIGLDSLADPTRRQETTVTLRGQPCIVPALKLLNTGRPLLWGLTYRFVCHLLQLVSIALPDYPDISHYPVHKGGI